MTTLNKIQNADASDDQGFHRAERTNVFPILLVVSDLYTYHVHV